MTSNIQQHTTGFYLHYNQVLKKYFMTATQEFKTIGRIINRGTQIWVPSWTKGLNFESPGKPKDSTLSP